MENINRYANSKTISGNNIKKVLESFGELEWGRCGPAIKEFRLYEDIEKEPHHTAWRWKNPDPKLDRLIVEAVKTFKGQVEWEIRSRERRPSLGGTNWIIEPVKKKQFYEKHKSLDGFELNELIKKEAPEIGLLSNQDVPRLAEHIKRYVEKNWQSNR